MTTKKDNRSLKSWIPSSYRGRAETFARNIQSRLRSFGSQDDNWSNNKQETSRIQKIINHDKVHMDYPPAFPQKSDLEEPISTPSNEHMLGHSQDSKDTINIKAEQTNERRGSLLENIEKCAEEINTLSNILERGNTEIKGTNKSTENLLQNNKECAVEINAACTKQEHLSADMQEYNSNETPSSLLENNEKCTEENELQTEPVIIDRDDLVSETISSDGTVNNRKINNLENEIVANEPINNLESEAKYYSEIKESSGTIHDLENIIPTTTLGIEESNGCMKIEENEDQIVTICLKLKTKKNEEIEESSKIKEEQEQNINNNADHFKLKFMTNSGIEKGGEQYETKNAECMKLKTMTDSEIEESNAITKCKECDGQDVSTSVESMIITNSEIEEYKDQNIINKNEENIKLKTDANLEIENNKVEEGEELEVKNNAEIVNQNSAINTEIEVLTKNNIIEENRAVVVEENAEIVKLNIAINSEIDNSNDHTYNLQSIESITEEHFEIDNMLKIEELNMTERVDENIIMISNEAKDTGQTNYSLEDITEATNIASDLLEEVITIVMNSTSKLEAHPPKSTNYKVPFYIDNVKIESSDEINDCFESVEDIIIAANKATETSHEERLVRLENITQSIKLSSESVDEIDCSFNYQQALQTDYHTTPKLLLQTPSVEDVDFLKSSNQLMSRLQVPSESNVTSDDDDDYIIPRVRRCSSLKTSKTPPGTPSQKKIVRFADVLGLDLADVRTFLDDIPNIPNSAYHDLSYVETNSEEIKLQKKLLILFQQPGGADNFLDKVQIKNVMLENAVIEDHATFSIRGVVRVKNLDFNKMVVIRYSLDSWKSYADLKTTYVENSCDGFTDKFVFLLYAHTLSIGQRLEFAVLYQCRGEQYWDNNGGANYCFQCLPASNPAPYAPITMEMDDQIATFYYDNSDVKKPQDQELTRTIVQDYIMDSLQKTTKPHEASSGKPELLTICVVVLFSIVFLYFKKAITIF